MPEPESKGRPAYRLYRIAWAGLDWLYPPRCGGCGRPGSRWCLSCQKNVLPILAPVCERCGEPQPREGVCVKCGRTPPAFTQLRSWAVFEGPLRAAIHRLKYKGDIALGDVFARPLASQLLSYGWPVNLIVPVPIGVARKSERGYNQAALIAWPVALCAGIAYRPNALKKVRETRSQVGLPASERRTNVAEAFQADPKTVRGKSVLIMDDVTTSGATIEACTNALLSAGANQVYGLTLARAKLDHPPGGSRNPQQVEVNAASQTM